LETLLIALCIVSCTPGKMYEIKIIPAEHVCDADRNSFNTMQRNLKYKSIITVEKHV